MKSKRFLIVLTIIVVNIIICNTFSVISSAKTEDTAVNAIVNADSSPLNVRSSSEILSSNIIGQFKDKSNIIIYPNTAKGGFVKAVGTNLKTGKEVDGWAYQKYITTLSKTSPTTAIKPSPTVQSTPEKTYTFSGIVKDKSVNKIIPGATVKLGTKSAVTDSNGKFVVEKVPKGSYNFSISKNSYAKYSTTISLTKNSNTQYVLSKSKECTFSGTLKDLDNETPLVSVKVTLGDITKTTDISGKFKFDKVLNTAYKLTISKSNYKTYSTTINLESNIDNLYYLAEIKNFDGLAPQGSEQERYDYIFGKGKSKYSSKTEAFSNMVNMKLLVWKLGSDGKKYSSNVYIDVNKKLEKTVTAILKDIYNDTEKFPIKSIGGWRWPDAYINHPSGTAIDINWEENAMYVNGKASVGKYWKPGKDPYSMSPTCSIVRIFTKYGWDWGGLWDTPKDYMHFSYLGG